MKVMLRPMLSYYGSKWRLAPKYPSPLYDTIIEPFAGGAGYSLLHHNRNVILIEKNLKVAAVWQYLISANSRDILDLPILKEDDCIDDFQWLSDAEKWLIGFWLNLAVSAPCKRLSKWSKLNNKKNSWGEVIRSRIASQVDCVSHWKVVNDDYQVAENIEATWFIDPPYQRQGKYYPNGSNAIDFKSLGEWCASRNGQVMVCENLGADWLPFIPFCEQSGTLDNITGKQRKSSEVIWFSPHCLSAAQGALF
jgi:site-specific DNA-adenine methylase